MKRVRVGSTYVYKPVAIDQYDKRNDAGEGQHVRVINMPGCPRANTMGHCHIESLDGEFLGMVHVASLVKG